MELTRRDFARIGGFNRCKKHYNRWPPAIPYPQNGNCSSSITLAKWKSNKLVGTFTDRLPVR